MSPQPYFNAHWLAAATVLLAALTTPALGESSVNNAGEDKILPSQKDESQKDHFVQKSGPSQKCGSVQKDCQVQKKCQVQKCEPEYRWETVVETRSRTVYENVKEVRQRTLYDTHFDYRTVQEVKHVPEIQYRQEEYTYQVPIMEPRTREVPYTTYHTVFETRTRNVNYVTYISVPETRTRSIPYTIYHTVPETGTRTETYTVPRQEQYTETISVPSGHYETYTEKIPGPVMRKCVQEPGCWKWDPCRCCCVYVPGKSRIVEVQCPPRSVTRRKWVPKIEQRLVHRTRTVYDTRTRVVPYTTYRSVPETRTRQVQYTVYKSMPLNQTRTVQYQVSRRIPQQNTRTETFMVKRMVTEVGTKTIPYTTYRDVPVTRTVCEPRTVPRTVSYTVTRRVPRTETYDVEVWRCVPTCEDAAKVSDVYGDAKPYGDAGVDLPAERADAPGVEVVPPGDEIPTPPAANDTTTTSAEAAAVLEQDEQDVASEETRPAVFTAMPAVEARMLFSRGLRDYWNSEYMTAAEQLGKAADGEPKNAKYAYFWALALRQNGDLEAAEKALDEAVRRESESPLPHLGRSLERVQGEHRLWLEAARRAAREN